ncbi:MAG: AMP-binding protein [Kiritimatiellaeota bacterium]|nr:AMP-binding protein [Kiritimatiellota bacterium]
MRIVCFGDSLTSCGGENGRYSDILADRFPGHEFINRGVGGETFEDALLRLDTDVLAQRPDIVLVEFGANDWWRDERPPSAWAADLDAIVARIRDVGAEPVILGVFGPCVDSSGRRVEKNCGADERSREFRKLEADIARKHRCPRIANIQERIAENRCCWRDRNHPNEFGNRFVADAVESVLTKLLGTTARPVRKPVLRTVRDFWIEAVELAPDRLAAVHEQRRLSYAEADALIRPLTAGLRRVSGVEHPKVAVFLPNCLEYYLLYWAVIRAGGVVVPLNTWLKSESLTGVFSNVRPDLLVVRNRFDQAVLAAARAASTTAVALDPGDSPELVGFKALLKCADRLGDTAPAPDDLAIIMHTSGTTAVPKGAMMRHSDLMFNVMTTVNAHQFGPGDVHLLVNPMFHCTALYSSLPTAAYQKTPVIITADTTPEGLLALVEREHITTFLSVPAIFQRIAAVPEVQRYDTSSLRLLAYAGSAMPVSTVRRLQNIFPYVDLHNFFGLTETISMTHVLLGEDAEQRPDSIGKLLPFVYAKVVNESLNEVPPGTVGELLFARDNVIPGYYNQPGKLEEALVALDDGTLWFRTGDLAAVDEEGYFFVKGRKKDMIIVGGENVYASEVEAVLMTHDNIREAAVKGVPATGVRASLGELIRAYVVRGDAALTALDVRRHCAARLPSYKVPHEVVFLDELPRNPSGKVVKTMLS